ncbi:MAG: hypothetical protein SGJ10_00240 [Bacteroidota bacterium]|nr:hypothetical protein [Bacteroidota bacterium]
MKRLLYLSLLLLIGFGTSSFGVQEDFADNLKKIVEASRQNFDPIKSERKNGIIDIYYTSKVSLPNATDTRIWVGNDQLYFTCKMTEKNNKSEIEVEYKKTVALVRACLGKWKEFVPKNTSLHSIDQGFKEEAAEKCGPVVIVSMQDNPVKYGFYKVIITVKTF